MTDNTAPRCPVCDRTAEECPAIIRARAEHDAMLRAIEALGRSLAATFDELERTAPGVVDAIARMRLDRGRGPEPVSRALVSPAYATKMKCRCTSEAGDSHCPVHPSCSECGKPIETFVCVDCTDRSAVRMVADRDRVYAELQDVLETGTVLPVELIAKARHWRSLCEGLGKQIEQERARPVDMLLFCPKCVTQHIDAPNAEKNWTNPPHRSHECQACQHVWRPADVATNGVAEIKTRGERDGSAVPDHEASPIDVSAERLASSHGEDWTSMTAVDQWRWAIKICIALQYLSNGDIREWGNKLRRVRGSMAHARRGGGLVHSHLESSIKLLDLVITDIEKVAP